MRKLIRCFIPTTLALLLFMFGAGPQAASKNDLSPEARMAVELRQRPGKFVEVILTEQRLVAWEDGRMVMTTPVSTGVRKTPTPRGTFRIYRKYEKQRMVGQGYDLPNVPWVMYFRTGGYAFHGTYWHTNFGQPMSHGCVNMPIGKAAWLYQWAPNGTRIVVY